MTRMLDAKHKGHYIGDMRKLPKEARARILHLLAGQNRRILAGGLERGSIKKLGVRLGPG